MQLGVLVYKDHCPMCNDVYCLIYVMQKKIKDHLLICVVQIMISWSICVAQIMDSTLFLLFQL
jgi:hypothetical protein